MSAGATQFDACGRLERFKAAGVPEALARVYIEALQTRDVDFAEWFARFKNAGATEAQARLFVEVMQTLDNARRA
jgi:hypothetical protein